MAGLMSLRNDPSVHACSKRQIFQSISLPLDFRRKPIMSPIFNKLGSIFFLTHFFISHSDTEAMRLFTAV